MDYIRTLHKWYLEKRIIALFRKNNMLRDRLVSRYGTRLE